MLNQGRPVQENLVLGEDADEQGEQLQVHNDQKQGDNLEVNEYEGNTEDSPDVGRSNPRGGNQPQLDRKESEGTVGQERGRPTAQHASFSRELLKRRLSQFLVAIALFISSIFPDLQDL